LIRAVCAIEAMDRNGNVLIKDARGRMHTIGGVEMKKLDNVAWAIPLLSSSPKRWCSL
jgi:hypothetical protein